MSVNFSPFTSHFFLSFFSVVYFTYASVKKLYKAATHARAYTDRRRGLDDTLALGGRGCLGAHMHGKGMEEVERGGEVEQEEKASDSDSAPEDVSLSRGREEALKTLKATSTEARR